MEERFAVQVAYFKSTEEKQQSFMQQTKRLLSLSIKLIQMHFYIIVNQEHVLTLLFLLSLKVQETASLKQTMLVNT